MSNEKPNECPDCGSPLEENGCCSDVGSNNCQYLGEGIAVPPCNNECYANVNNNVQCNNEMDGYACSRIPGHSGKHVACGAEHAILVWENKNENNGM